MNQAQKRWSYLELLLISAQPSFHDTWSKSPPINVCHLKRIMANVNLTECHGLKCHPPPADLSSDTNIHMWSFLQLLSPTFSKLLSQFSDPSFSNSTIPWVQLYQSVLTLMFSSSYSRLFLNNLTHSHHFSMTSALMIPISPFSRGYGHPDTPQAPDDNMP